jgi:hypothetical protein
MLPWAHGVRVTEANGGTVAQAATHNVRHQAVLVPVATPNYIASPRRGDVGGMSFGMEETLAHGCSNDFAAGLAGAVGIVSSQHIRFPITPGPVQVIVDLVAGHDHHRSCLGTMANDVEQGCNSDDVGGERLDRSDIGATDERLRRHMNYDLGSSLSH